MCFVRRSNLYIYKITHMLWPPVYLLTYFLILTFLWGNSNYLRSSAVSFVLFLLCIIYPLSVCYIFPICAVCPLPFLLFCYIYPLSSWFFSYIINKENCLYGIYFYTSSIIVFVLCFARYHLSIVFVIYFARYNLFTTCVVYFGRYHLSNVSVLYLAVHNCPLSLREQRWLC